jgi:hypothetical protein
MGMTVSESVLNLEAPLGHWLDLTEETQFFNSSVADLHHTFNIERFQVKCMKCDVYLCFTANSNCFTEHRVLSG